MSRERLTNAGRHGSMKYRTANNHIVELEQVPGAGSPWMVRVYKRILMFKKRVSSDWFLDEGQARKFAEELARELSDHSTKGIEERKPGWTLHRAP